MSGPPFPVDGAHIGFVTSVTPTGETEAFVLAEIVFLRRAGLRVTVAPVRDAGTVFHAAAQEVLPDSLVWPVLDTHAVLALVRTALRRPRRLSGVVATILRASGSPRLALKNLAALAKACRLADAFAARGVTHVHGAWASVPASVAWIVGRLTGLPWSFCAIRWDVAEGNLVLPKLADALFVRATTQGAATELVAHAGVREAHKQKVHVIPHGVDLPEAAPERAAGAGGEELRIVSVGFLLPKKGHRYLVDACALLRDRGVSVRCEIIGSGPLEGDLRLHIAARGLGDRVTQRPSVPHRELLELYASDRVDLLVLPSIVADDGQREGLPASLLEALARGLPVLSTPTGDISELLGGMPDALVPPADAEALASRLAELAQDRERLRRIGVRGRTLVQEGFDITRNVGVRLRGLLTEGPAAG